MVKLMEARVGNPVGKEVVAKGQSAPKEGAGTKPDPFKVLEVFLGKTKPATAEALGEDAKRRATTVFDTFGSQFMKIDTNPIRNGNNSKESPVPTFTKGPRVQVKDDGGTGPGDDN